MIMKSVKFYPHLRNEHRPKTEQKRIPSASSTIEYTNYAFSNCKRFPILGLSKKGV